MAYIFDPLRNTFIDDEDTSLGNKLALLDDDLEKAIREIGEKYGSDTIKTLDQLPENKPAEVEDTERFNRFNRMYEDGGRVNQQAGTDIMTLNPLFPEKSTDFMSEEFKPIDVPGGFALPVGIGLGAKKLSDIFFSKDKDDKKDLEQSDDKNNLIKGDGPDEPDPLDDLAQSYLIDEAIDRLKKKEMDLDKRTDKTLLARDLDLDIPKSGLYDLRKDETFFKNRLKFLKKKGVNFDGYYSTSEIANLLGIKTGSGVRDFVVRKNVPMVKKGLFNVLTLNDFLTAYEPTKERIQKAPPPDLANLARQDFLKDNKSPFFERFKRLKFEPVSKSEYIPPEIRSIYDKYNLSQIEGGHPFPVEFFTKKFGKKGTLQKERQFDWIYRNKDKLFNQNDLVFQSKDINQSGGPFYSAIAELKPLYKKLGEYVDKYEGKGAVKNKKDIDAISKLNLDIMKIIGNSKEEVQNFIKENPDSKLTIPKMKTGGLHGAIFDYETGEVELYAPDKQVLFESGAVEDIETEKGTMSGQKLKIAESFLDVLNQVVDDKKDLAKLLNYFEGKMLPRFKKGGGVEISPMPRAEFGNGGAAGVDNDFAAQLEYFFLNPDAELPAAQTFKETMNPIEIVNDMIDPRNFPYYADRLVESGIRIGEFGARVLPAVGKLAADLIQKPAFKIKPAEGQGYVQDYTDIPPSNITGTGIFSEFLNNLVGSEGTKAITEKTGLDKLIKDEEQKMKDERKTAGAKILADQVTLGMELTAPIFPGLKLLKAYAKNRNLPVDKTTREIMDKEIDEVLTKQGISRRDFMKVAGAGGAVAIAKLLGIGDDLATVTKVAEKAVPKGPIVPPYFFTLVDKIKRLGTDNTKGLATVDREVVYVYKDYELYEDLSTGNIRITRKIGDETGYKEEEMVYTKGIGDESTQGTPSDEYDEFTVRADPDGKMKNIDNGLEELDDLIDEIGAENITIKDLEAMGYEIDRLPMAVQRKLGIQKPVSSIDRALKKSDDDLPDLPF